MPRPTEQDWRTHQGEPSGRLGVCFVGFGRKGERGTAYEDAEYAIYISLDFKRRILEKVPAVPPEIVEALAELKVKLTYTKCSNGISEAMKIKENEYVHVVSQAKLMVDLQLAVAEKERRRAETAETVAQELRG